MKECVTHHHACDCREAEFDKLRAERDAFQRDAYGLLQVSKVAADALERAEAERDTAQAEVAAYRQALTRRVPVTCDDIEWRACLRWVDKTVAEILKECGK